MRTALLAILLVACSKDSGSRTDASVHVVDAKAIDAAPPDAPPDAPNMNVTAACMHACDALATCIGQQADPECYSGCATDLADCSVQQVATIDACSNEQCGDLQNNASPLLDCITAVSCVSGPMAMTSPHK